MVDEVEKAHVIFNHFDGCSQCSLQVPNYSRLLTPLQPRIMMYRVFLCADDLVVFFL
jgi:hypothetical protein